MLNRVAPYLSPFDRDRSERPDHVELQHWSGLPPLLVCRVLPRGACIYCEGEGSEARIGLRARKFRDGLMLGAVLCESLECYSHSHGNCTKQADAVAVCFAWSLYIDLLNSVFFFVPSLSEWQDEATASRVHNHCRANCRRGRASGATTTPTLGRSLPPRSRRTRSPIRLAS